VNWRRQTAEDIGARRDNRRTRDREKDHLTGHSQLFESAHNHTGVVFCRAGPAIAGFFKRHRQR
jgi:hypothetical protein